MTSQQTKKSKITAAAGAIGFLIRK